ncbi:Myb-like DNA-binding domain [Phytophthora infestans]|uniref:Myb-like DNA-binding domain n=1 Tax=Phytophthora infestans TaxID=4787 RepID=A0A833SH41_PHYIN|nr:Myb-like DNA-binding domain [Phytophthora infestans]
MTISETVKSALFVGDVKDKQLIRLPTRAAEAALSKRRRRSRRRDPPTERSRQLWKVDEHDRFLEALELYPSGPWKAIADYIGTRTARQTITHAQKYRQKIERRKLKPRKNSIDSSCDMSSEDELTSPSTETLTAKAATSLLDEATELSVLLEFVNSFQPSEIEHTTPLLYSHDSVLMVGVHF